MTMTERESALANLSYEGRVAFVAFCAERCIGEARRHQAAADQLRRQPELAEAAALLWTTAEGRIGHDASRLAELRAQLLRYEHRDPTDMVSVYDQDITLVYAARVLLLGLRIVQEPPAATPRLVATAVDGPGILVATIYEDAEKARDAEDAVLDQGLLLLKAASPPLTRRIFDGIADWARGPLRSRYAEGRLTDSSIDPDEE